MVAAWWPHAIGHGLHPLLTDLVYAPGGWNLAWTSSIPGPALLAWPLTAAFGPVPAYDVLALAAPALAAWCTYLLCRALETGTPAALAGGLVFGFGTYEAAETLNHLNLALVFTLPLAGLVVARYLRGSLSDRRFVVLFALCVAGVFATFLETLFWATLGGAVALGLGIAFARGNERDRLVRCLVLASLAYGIALVVAAPYLWVALAHPDPLGISGRGFELDLANLIIPTRVTALRPSSLHHLASQLGGNNLTEQLGYVGPVLPAIAGFALWERRRQPFAAGPCHHDRRRDRARARLAPCRGRASHLASAAVDARRQPAAREPRAACPGLRARVACAGRGSRAVPGARRRAALGRLRPDGAHARSEPGRKPLVHAARPAGALRGGPLAVR